jgi:hypothetical protein
MHISPVTVPFLENCFPTSLFTTGYKRLTERGVKLLDGEGFLMGGFWLERGLLKGKKLLKGKELLKGNC